MINEENINMQQTIVDQVSDIDQPLEDVQLTELQPVKQSRIRENNSLKDTDATDALKALRSFNDECNVDQQAFDLQVFDYNNTSTQENQRVGSTRKRTCRFEIIIEDDESVGSDPDDPDYEVIDEKLPKFRRNNRLKNWNKYSKTRNVCNKVGKKRSDKSTIVDEETLSSVCEDEEYTNLDLERAKDTLNDEVFDFRQVVESSSSDKNDLEEDSEDSVKSKKLKTKEKSNKSPRKAEAENVENEDRSKDGQSSRESSSEISEDELKRRIDAIIQANLRMERENNNTVESSSPKDSDVPIKKSKSKTPKPIPIVTCKSPNVSYRHRATGAIKKFIIAKNENEPSEKKYCCVVCDARFKGSGGLRNHYKVVHAAGPLYKCDECGKEFPLKERLKLHVRTHTGFKPYKCNQCDKTFARGGQLVQHRRTHTQVKPYRCTICSGTFTCAANLALHVKRHNGQKDHKCDICGRGFVRRDALKKHLECLHRDMKSFLCVICNKTFKGHLPQHMRTHARDRPHGCATCGQRFAQKSQLTVHQRTHSGQRPFRCVVCWQAFAHSTALKLHTRRHTGERPFKCDECNSGFTQLPHWKKHMKCIHGRSEPYNCKRCHKFFRIKSELENHEKTCHRKVDKKDEETTTPTTTNNEVAEKTSTTSKYKVMTVEKMRLLLAVLLKRISKPEKLDELGFGKRLIDAVLHDSLISAGKEPVTGDGSLTELQILTKNLEIFLEWTVPKAHWEQFRKLKKTPEEILETLTAT